ncbi:hypothetical protein MSG28_005322 [Choristoneura fumiferana]|uniref:Uncharacterized protein n=1 Tax=Choristoneura fumiferana TaxID=7141 RepID=A0ACC0JR15_CHOFU|nr:hypothetical protein MSG28_005322 [Choristoneura fumiferana]
MKHQMRRKYRIESLSAATFPGALKVIREAFFQDEAVCIGTEIHKDPEAIEELLELCASAALDGVSLVAVARQKERYMTPTPFTSMELRYPSPVASDSTEKTFLDLFEERNTRPSCLSLVHFIKDVEGRCNFFEKYHADCCLDITWLAVIREAFCQDEAVSIGSEVNKDPAAIEELLELCADAALDGVSLVAVAVDSGDVVAVYQAECSLEIMFLATLREHRGHNLGTILCKLSIDLAKKLKEGPVANMSLTDLGPKFSHMKPREVTKIVPKICQAIWTGEATQKIGRKLGFKVEVKAMMSEFIYNGKTYADRLGDQSSFSELASIVLD